MKLLCHINGDSDILRVWLDWYLRLGVDSFHFIVHGPKHENTMLYKLSGQYPIVIVEGYEGEFLDTEKESRINRVAQRLRGEWIVSMDSDEFLELPYDSLAETIDRLESVGADALLAPMLQRVRLDGTLVSGETIEDPFSQFPFCIEALYSQMGVHAETKKYPLFFCSEDTFLNAGNHSKPRRKRTVLSDARGVTHHFKWRQPVLKRLKMRIESKHNYRAESVGYLEYLKNNNFHLPLEGAFTYSRAELFQRGLLKRVGFRCKAHSIIDRALNWKS
ncbi:glycosyltransferase family 2 protein [Thermodesulfobacteriota bacterium]